MICPYCNKPAKYGPNEEFYGKRYGRSYMCYYCKDCDAYVGTHNNTERALGTMANQELRNWRRKAHAMFDPFWQEFGLDRNEAYGLLQTKFGHRIHIGEADIETCQQIVKFCEERK